MDKEIVLFKSIKYKGNIYFSRDDVVKALHNLAGIMTTDDRNMLDEFAYNMQDSEFNSIT